MARTDKLFYQQGATINIGNYESVRVDVGEGITIEAGDDIEREWDELKDRVREELANRIEEVKTQKKRTELNLGRYGC